MSNRIHMDGGLLRERAVLLCGAGVYALLYALGSQIDEYGRTQLAQSLLRFILAFPAALAVLSLLMRRVLPHMAFARREEGKKPFCTWGAFCLILMSFIPLFLIEYPGSFMYDSQAQTFQIARNEYSMFHPLLHTLLLRACLSLYGIFNSFEKCAAVYSLISMLLIASCFAQVCASVSRSVSRGAARICTAFFCLYPTHMALASNYTKDGLFAAFFALFLSLCCEEILCGKLRLSGYVLQGVAGVLACLLRNNMIYAMVAWTLLLLLLRRRYLRLALAALAIIVLSRGVNTGLGVLTSADKGNIAEMLSVPIQQLARARVYAGEVFTDEEKTLLDEVCVYEKYGFTQVWNRYEPTLSDPVKNYLNTDVLQANMRELADMWLRIGRACPDIYLDAFLALALPSYYPYKEYRVAQPYIEIGIQPGVLTAPFGQEPMVQPRRFAALRQWLYENIYQTGMDDVPVIRYLFNTGFIFWLLLLFALYAAFRGDWTRLTWMMLAVLLWGTYLLGPVMQGRYLYPFVCILPLFILMPETVAKVEIAK